MTQAERKHLTESLKAVRRVLGHAGIFGGREVTTAYDFERRIMRLLEPESAAALCAEADAFTAINLPFIDKGRQQAAEREAAQRIADEQVKHMRDAMHERQAAQARERAEREQRRSRASCGQ
jgi:hypothetical protein